VKEEVSARWHMTSFSMLVVDFQPMASTGNTRKEWANVSEQYRAFTQWGNWRYHFLQKMLKQAWSKSSSV
jgi:hypothetical protein